MLAARPAKQRLSRAERIGRALAVLLAARVELGAPATKTPRTLAGLGEAEVSAQLEYGYF